MMVHNSSYAAHLLTVAQEIEFLVKCFLEISQHLPVLPSDMLQTKMSSYAGEWVVSFKAATEILQSIDGDLWGVL